MILQSENLTGPSKGSDPLQALVQPVPEDVALHCFGQLIFDGQPGLDPMLDIRRGDAHLGRLDEGQAIH